MGISVIAPKSCMLRIHGNTRFLSSVKSGSKEMESFKATNFKRVTNTCLLSYFIKPFHPLSGIFVGYGDREVDVILYNIIE